MGSRFLAYSIVGALAFASAHFLARWFLAVEEPATAQAARPEAVAAAPGASDSARAGARAELQGKIAQLVRRRDAGFVREAEIPDLGRLALSSPRDAAILQSAITRHFNAVPAPTDCFNAPVEQPFSIECTFAVTGQTDGALAGGVESCRLVEGWISEEVTRCLLRALSAQRSVPLFQRLAGQFRGRVPFRLSYEASPSKT